MIDSCTMDRSVHTYLMAVIIIHATLFQPGLYLLIWTKYTLCVHRRIYLGAPSLECSRFFNTSTTYHCVPSYFPRNDFACTYHKMVFPNFIENSYTDSLTSISNDAAYKLMSAKTLNCLDVSS